MGWDGDGQEQGVGRRALCKQSPSPAQLVYTKLSCCSRSPSTSPGKGRKGEVSFPWVSGTQLGLHVRITWVLLEVTMSRPILGYGPSVAVYRAPGATDEQPRLEAAALAGALLRGWLKGELLQPGGLSAVSPILCRKGPVEAKSESQETETKPAPAEVKTVPNDATQTKENESKA